jgi:hypothetical protein
LQSRSLRARKVPGADSGKESGSQASDASPEGKTTTPAIPPEKKMNAKVDASREKLGVDFEKTSKDRSSKDASTITTKNWGPFTISYVTKIRAPPVTISPQLKKELEKFLELGFKGHPHGGLVPWGSWMPPDAGR